jgi:predicted O-methyltransferase YrrM
MWQVHAAISELMQKGDFQAAIAQIAAHRDECFGKFSPLFVLEAACVARGDRPEHYIRAAEILQEAASFDPANFWIFYNLSHYLTKLGRAPEAQMATWRVHRLLGWPESEAKGYEFTHDYFAGNIPQWSEWFATLITMRPIYCLEIGSWQGASATWLLDKVISDRGGLLTCVDTFTGSSEHQGILKNLGLSLEGMFDRNIARTGHKAMCRKRVGSSQKWLRRLPYQSYDFIYIDGAHEAKYVIQDAVLSVPLLKSAGFMLVGDVNFCFPDDPSQNTAKAVDFLLEVFHEEIECVHKGRQVLLKRTN